jgi:hypothetical protein
MRRHEDEDEKTYFRSDRIYSMNGQWYFGTREGDCGPFVSREGALAALARFVNEVVELGPFQKSRELVTRTHRPKPTLADRLRLAKQSKIRRLDASELLI